MSSTLARALPLLGIIVALYALYVEHRKSVDSSYEAMCDIEGVGKCSDVLLSEYGHILSKWGLVAPGSPLDVPNPVLGILYYLLVLLWPLPSRQPVLAAAALSLAFSAYLAWVLATVLKDFCLVCVTSYVVNAGIFAVEACLPVVAPGAKAAEGAAPPTAGRKGGEGKTD